MFESVGEERLLSLSSKKLQQLKEQQPVEITCAQKVAPRYQDSRCMGTTINASVPYRIDQTEMFYFDKVYFRKCHYAKSNKSYAIGAAYYFSKGERK